jgi:sulfate adenylyltransferase
MLNIPVASPDGFCVWLTGLPCSGKTTIANALARILERDRRTVTLLDGDIIRPILCPDLGFTRADRHTNNLRIAFVAREIVRHGGAAICATISPYREDRAEIRAFLGSLKYIEVYVKTPLEVCESRDDKGMYRMARRGEIRDFTGVDAPYEPPLSADIVCNTQVDSPERSARKIGCLISAPAVRVASMA